MKQKVSFIVAVYDREDYLKQCLDSILAQTYANFELVIINDGSTDNSESIIKLYKDDRIKYFKNEHQGCWSTKNFGIKQACGEFVCFIDSDDFISSDFLSNAMPAIKQNPLFDYYYPTSLNIVTELGKPTNDIWRYLSVSLSERPKLIKLFWDRQIGGIPHVASLIRKEIFEKYGYYNDTFFNLSDTAYIISNALNIRFFPVSELKTYYNRQHSKQTNSHFAERMRTYSEILDEIVEKYPSEFYLDKADSPLPPSVMEVNYVSTKEIYEKCLEKFMELSQKTEHNEYLLKKAEKYLRLMRN